MVGIREGNENTWSIRSSDVKIDIGSGDWEGIVHGGEG